MEMRSVLRGTGIGLNEILTFHTISSIMMWETAHIIQIWIIYEVLIWLYIIINSMIE